MARGVIDSEEPFWNQDLQEILLRLSASCNLSPLELNTPARDALILRTATKRGIGRPHTFRFKGTWSPCHPDLKREVDEVVLTNYGPRTRQTDSASQLATQAALVRGYFCLLFSASPVVEYECKIWNDFRIQGTYYGNNLGLRLLIFAIARINELVTHIMESVRLHNSNDYNTDSLDVAGAAALLYTGLMYVLEGLQSGKLLPLWGGEQLPGILEQRVSAVANELIQHQRVDCSKVDNWSELIEGPLEDLRSGIDIQSMSITLERHVETTAIIQDANPAFPHDPSPEGPDRANPNTGIPETEYHYNDLTWSQY